MNVKKLKKKKMKMKNGDVIEYLPYFHNYEYRHLLRSATDMGEYKGHKRVQIKWFERKYIELYGELQKAGLAVDGFSVEHAKVIEKVFGFKHNEIITEYHKGEQ